LAGVKALVVISSGDEEKALVAASWAANARLRGWADDVVIVVFGPAEKLLLSGGGLLDALKIAQGAGARIYFCRRYAETRGFAEELERVVESEDLGSVEYVGPLIAELISKGYTPLVF
jgi:hypothetical protein